MNPLSNVSSWLYHLGQADAARIEEIAVSDVDLVVLDYAKDDQTPYSSAEVSAMRGQNEKLLVSYLSVGEAESYRSYFGSTWLEEPPTFMAESNPEWPNNYKVKYWDPDWKGIIFDYIDEIIAAEFDGLYLDIIDAFYYWEETAPRADEFYRLEMVSFVQEMRAHADAQLAATGGGDDFVIIGQNSEALTEYAAFLETVDGVAKEDLYFYYENEQPQDFAPKSDASRTRNMEELERAEAAGVEVMVVEYVPPEAASTAAEDLAAEWAYLEALGVPLYVSEERDLLGIYTSYDLGGDAGSPPDGGGDNPDPEGPGDPVDPPDVQPPVDPSGDDTLVARADTPVLDGGAGWDTAVLDGDADDYILTIDGAAGTIVIADKRPDGTGTHRLESIERLLFDGGVSSDEDDVVELTGISGAAALTVDQLTALTEMYVAYFDRAPDAEGLLYWGGRLADGMGLGEIAQSFFVQPEARDVYPDPDDVEQFVQDTYDNLFGRDPDPEGEAYWIDQLTRGEVNQGEFVLAVINGAKAATGSALDAQTIAEKGQIGYSFAVTNGLSNVDHADDVMDTYDTSDRAGTIADAQDLIAEYRVEAEAMDSEEFIVELIGLGDDPLALL